MNIKELLLLIKMKELSGLNKFGLIGIIYPDGELLGSMSDLNVSFKIFTFYFDKEPDKSFVEKLDIIDFIYKEFQDFKNTCFNNRDLFVANISHEIRTPINGIVGMIDLLSLTKLDEDQQNYIDTMKQCQNNLLSVISDIMDYSKIKNGKLEIIEMSCLIGDILEQVKIMNTEKIQDKSLTLKIVNEINEWIYTDPERIKQVLNNVLYNSVKFTNYGSITITVSKKNDEIIFVIKDTGIGIPKDKIPNAFNSFVKFNSEYNRQYDGNGLGLFICKNVIELLGGKIHLDSEENVGTTITFTIPYKPCTIAYTEDNISKLLKKSVLVITDNLESRDDLFKYLNNWKMIPFFASRLDDLKSYLENGIINFDMFLFDTKNTEECISIVSNYIKEPKIITIGTNTYGYPKVVKPVNKTLLFEYIHKGLFIGNNQIQKKKSKQNDEFNNNYNFLIVEDTINNQKVLVGFLKQMGFKNIDIANNGVECLMMMKKKKYDILFMDIKMPIMDGFEATRNIIKDYPKEDRPVIIALTAVVSEYHSQECFSAGMNDYLSKPIRYNTILNCLKKYIKF